MSIINIKKLLIMRFYFLLFVLSLSWFSCSVDESALDSGSSQAGSTASMIIYNDYMYVLDNDFLRVLSLENPKNPQLVKKINIGENNETIFGYENHLYIGSSLGMRVVDITIPNDPKLISDIPQFISHDPIVIKNDTAFQTRRFGTEDSPQGGTLIVHDVQNPSNPFVISSINLPFPMGLDFKDNTLYVCNGPLGISLIDITDALHPIVIKQINEFNIRDCIVVGNRLVGQSSTGLIIFDISDGINPQFITEVK